MEIEHKNILTGLGFLITWLGAFFAVGRIYGKLIKDVELNTKDILKIKRCMVNDNGEPVLMSYAAHDIYESKCQRLMDERYSRMDIRLGKHDTKLDKILEVVSALEERSKYARTREGDDRC